LKTIGYFSFFDYPPTLGEIYTFLEKKAEKKEVKETLKSLERWKKIKKIKDLNGVIRYSLFVTGKYTVGEYSTHRQAGKFKIQNLKFKIEKYNQKYLFSQEKLQNWRFRLYVRILSFFPQIKLIGLSGSLAMMNALKNDDIDLFIITAKNRLFTGRFIAIVLAKILMIHRSYTKGYKLQVTSYTNKVCLNLFFDEINLVVPDCKRNEYVAHEVLQMKPIINKSSVYERFLKANYWMLSIFPNAKKRLKVKSQKFFKDFKFLIFIFHFSLFIFNSLGDKIEKILKSFQMCFINKHKTTEIITDTQLWFHPEDFYNKIKKIRK